MLILSLLAVAPAAHAQDLASGRKQARAVRLAGDSIRLDGRLDEAAWLAATPVIDFVQKEPVEGAAATDPMEVRFVFDDAALYIGARMTSAGRDAVQAPLGRRDNVDQAEYIQLSLDTYLDRRTAYTFGVSASGVRIDHYHPSDDEDVRDATFDPVWEAQTTIDDSGWTAELWVPFSQLRFNESDERVWGLNIQRWTPTRNEESYWVPILRTERGWASRFGELRGLDSVRPPRRLELLPYVAASSRTVANRNPANPFDRGLNGVGRVGADLKMSVGANLTLDATVNPDFGQVEADPAEVNLTVNETFFSERRPFFTEGSQLLAGASNNFFYSRRIGAVPRGPADGDFVDYPSATTILGAAKLTGRLPSGTSIGALGAVTANEFADTFSIVSGDIARTRVAPRATYLVGRVRQEVGRGGSSVGLQVAGLHRDLPPDEGLSSLFVRSTFTGAADALVRLQDATYEGRVVVGFSHVTGEAAAIERVQRTSVHYFQRPDREGGALLDPTRESLSGMQLRSNFDRIAGRHWLWGVTVNADSPEFETNDVGRLTGAGEIDLRGRLQYRETQPRGILRRYSFEFEGERSTDFDDSLGALYSLDGDDAVTWRNFWQSGVTWSIQSRGVDSRLTRGGPAMGIPRSWTGRVYTTSSDATNTQWGIELGGGGSEDGDRRREISLNLSVRPSPAWQLEIDPTYVRETVARQYVARVDGGGPDTFGARYVFGGIDRATASMQIRFNYTFKPDLNLDIYAEPFDASGTYSQFGELIAARERALRVYGSHGTTIVPQAGQRLLVTDGSTQFTLNNPDFHVRSFRSNVVLRWEWRPGSTVYAVWQQNRLGSGPLDARADFGGLFRSLSAGGDNILAIKASWWISPR